MSRVWREPAEETEDYPGLVVNDHRVSGSITVGRSRLPLWAFVGSAVHEDWQYVEDGWSPTEHYGFTEGDLIAFLGDLLEQRGEFGRLVLLLADVERAERTRRAHRWWFDVKKDRKRLAAQLRRCLALLEAS